MTPLKRYYNLLNLEKKDIYQLFLYAIFAGIISLSLPMGIQSIINLIQSGQVSTSWIVLIVLVVLGVVFGGILSIMQLRITENLQQKIFIRSSFEFATRLSKIEYSELYQYNPIELSNRFFDTLAIQKGTSKLLLDFSAAFLQIVFGVILLSLYHNFFIFFGILLVLLLYLIFKFSFNDGLDTSMFESKYKYKVANWLQEIARNNFSFKRQENYQFALQKNDTLVSNYLNYREKHFKVLRKQFSQLIVFKVIITASLLSIGGYLVLSQKMNIGQFVAAEIIILMVISSVEKIVTGLESLYDVLTSVEKIGQVTDLVTEKSTMNADFCYTNITLTAENLNYKFPEMEKNALKNINLTINQGEKIYVEGENASGKTTFIRILAGLIKPTSGMLFINDDTFKKIDLNQYRSQVGTIIYGETPFEGTILENITFRKSNISDNDLKWAIDAVQLTPFIKTLPEGLETNIYADRKLSSSNAQKILLARCIVNKPKIIFLEDPTDKMDLNVAKEIIDFLTDPKQNWTVIVSSKNEYWKQKCNRVISLKNGKKL